jgi:hypothetical protein
MNFLFQFCEKQMAAMAAVRAADEIWINNSNKNSALVMGLDG